MKSSDVSCDPPIVEVMGCFVQILILWHGPDDAFLEPGQKGLDWLALYCGLSIDVEDVRGTPWAVVFGEPGDRAVVQQFDPFDGPMDTVAVADGEARKAFVFFIPGGYPLPSFFLETFEPLMKVSDGFRILLLFLMMNSVSLADGLYELLSEVAESDRVVDVKPLNDVSSRGWGNGVDVWDGHKDGGRGTGRAVRCHGNVGIWRAEWERVG